MDGAAVSGNAGWRVGIDTGGTFTDLVAVNGVEFRTAKVPSTPPSYERGAMDVIRAAGIAIGDIAVLAHGTTVATNAVITRGGTTTALLTTRGFRDVLELRRHNRGDMYDILWDPPAPLVPRRLRYEIRERLDYQGQVLTRLNEQDVEAAAKAAIAAGAESLAICFLHSYTNPDHERRAEEIVRAVAPGVHVYTSAEVLREPNEFERTSTVVVNAYVGPVVADYLRALETLLGDDGFKGRLFVMHSGGGLLSAETAVQVPARLLTSGRAAGAMAAEGVGSSGSPSGGVVAATEIGRLAGEGDVISLDIGGTSADIAVIRNGRARLVNEYTVEFGTPIRFPTIDLTVIGAGGGSIAAVDAGGLPRVGPQSAGALPGPAAYGRGGTDTTVTDAHVVLGRLSPETPLAGGVALDVDLAEAAVQRFAERLGLSLHDAAAGVIAIANGNMARAIRLVTVERGLDPRGFTLVPFGGAGGLHGAEIAELLGIKTVIIPISPGVTSALGCLYVDIVHDAAQAYIVPLLEADVATITAIAEDLSTKVQAFLEADNVPEDRQELGVSLDVRYLGQVRSITIPVAVASVELPTFKESLENEFLDAYAAQFFYAPSDIPIELAAVRVRGVGRQERPQMPGATTDAAEGMSYREREILTAAGRVVVPLYDRRDLHLGNDVAGPAIVYQADSTTWVPAGWQCALEDAGHLRLTRDGDGAGGAEDQIRAYAEAE